VETIVSDARPTEIWRNASAATRRPVHIGKGERAPCRVLHVVSRMRRAGIESWLMNMLRTIDRSRFQMDFLVQSPAPADFDEEIRALGSELICGGPIRHIVGYVQRIRKLLLDRPAYDIVHAHVDMMSGYALKSAAEAGVPVRVAHSHNDQARGYERLRWPLKLLSRRGKSLIARYGTHGLAASDVAGETLFGTKPRGPAWRVLPCGIDLLPFSHKSASKLLRGQLGIPADAIVIGHVGRFEDQKNHQQILAIAEVLLKRSSRFHVVLAGDGLLRPSIEERVRDRGLDQHFSFLGVRSDVPQLLDELFDVFLFPSRFEGLGLALVEAQAAGCPAVVSNVIPHEADVVRRLVKRMPLAASPESWADAVVSASRLPRTVEASTIAYDAVVRSRFNIRNSVQALSACYDDLASCPRAAVG
jgi:glycosyltransferase involved in cell wall biosynthesis